MKRKAKQAKLQRTPQQDGRDRALGLILELRFAWSKMPEAKRFTFPKRAHVQKYIAQINGMSPEVQKGFYAILSDFLMEASADYCNAPSVGYYMDAEKRGDIQDL